MTDTPAHQLYEYFERGDTNAAQQLLAKELKQPLTDREAGAYQLQLIRMYLRYMTQLNEQYAEALDEASDILRDINRKERRYRDYMKTTEEDM